MTTFAKDVLGKVLEVTFYSSNQEYVSRYRIVGATSRYIQVVDSTGRTWREGRYGSYRILPADARLFEGRITAGITIAKHGAPVGFIPKG